MTTSLTGIDDGVGFGVRGTSGPGKGVVGECKTDDGVRGLSNSGNGVAGVSKVGTGVNGSSSKGSGVVGSSEDANGILGTSLKGDAIFGQVGNKDTTAVVGQNKMDGNGVLGMSAGGVGVFGETSGNTDKLASGVVGNCDGEGYGVVGLAPGGRAGVLGQCKSGDGVSGQTENANAAGVLGINSGSGPGVHGSSANGTGVVGDGYTGISAEGADIGADITGNGRAGVNATCKIGVGVNAAGGITGVAGISPYIGVKGGGGLAGVSGTVDPPSHTGLAGVLGIGNSSTPGVRGTNDDGGIGVYGESIDGSAIFGRSNHSTNAGPFGFAGNFVGAVNVTGPVHKSGGGFKIDHPLQPATKYLNHSFVESPDMKNIYDGVTLLNAKGEATVKLPEWFSALNGEFRYQLTAIGEAAPELHILSEMSGNKFRIGGGRKGGRVSWQVTGIRQDPWAQANRIIAEEQKTRAERGTYRHPEVLGQPDDLSVEWVHNPGLFNLLKSRRREGMSLAATHVEFIKEAAKKLESTVEQGKKVAKSSETGAAKLAAKKKPR